MEHNAVWILAESRGGRVQDVSLELLTRALMLADGKRPVCALILGYGLENAELNRLIVHGADRVVVVEDPALEHPDVRLHAECIAAVVREFAPEVLIAGATLLGRVVMPYAAMLCSTGLTADCTLLEMEESTGLLTQTRPAIGGNIMASIQCRTCRPQMATVRPHSTRRAPALPGRNGTIHRMAFPSDRKKERVKFFEFRPDPEGSTLQSADRIVVVGRGIRKPETLNLVRLFAERIGASVGATREVVDRGWLDYPHQIGLSGRTVTPKLYIGLGVSGAIQHLAGMQTSGTIIAVNKDPEAQIFKVADFGICGDLFEVLPALMESAEKGEFPC